METNEQSTAARECSATITRVADILGRIFDVLNPGVRND